MTISLLLLINLAATWFMTGLIWFVQLVHYPQFAGVGDERFCDYHRRHARFTTFVVAPPMLVEGLTALLLAIRPPAGHGAIMWIGLALVVVIALSTALLQVPRHNELGLGFRADSCRRLCRTNWIRTAAWTARAALMFYAVAASLRA